MNAIKELLQYSGHAQKELQLSVGVSQPTVSEWVRNKKDPSGERLEKVAEFFGVDWRVVKCLMPIPGKISVDSGNEEDIILWEAREAARRDPNRKILFDLAKNGSEKQIKQIIAIVDALKATNPDFIDGDDPA